MTSIERRATRIISKATDDYGEIDLPSMVNGLRYEHARGMFHGVCVAFFPFMIISLIFVLVLT